VDHAAHVAKRGGSFDEGVHGLPGGHVDSGGADVETSVGQNLGCFLGVALTEVGEQDMLACADPPGDGLGRSGQLR
jgi:hypothetical protein